MKILNTIIAIMFVGLFTLSGCNTNEKKIKYYQHPENPGMISSEAMKDEKGRDYIAVYEEAKKAKPVSSEVWYWTCSMHPDVKVHQYGSCPICKMDLVEVEYPKKQELPVDFYYCPMHPDQRSDTPGNCPICSMELAPQYVMDKNIVANIILTPEQEKLIHVQISKVEYRNISKTISTVGKINYNEKKMSIVSSRINGRVDKLFANFTGVKVKKNQALLLIYSPSLVTTQQELLQAQKDLSNAVKSGEATMISLSRTLLESSRSKLLLWGMANWQINKILSKGSVNLHTAIYSPVSGTVIKMNVTSGIYVKEGTILYEIADLRNVWMESEIYEEDISEIKIGAKIEAKSISYPGEVFKGKITFIHPILDPTTRTIKIRAEFDNSKGKLKPGMYVDAKVISPSNMKMLSIPATALLNTGIRKVVYVATGNGKYEGRNVVTKPQVGDYYPVISGVKENENIVTYGAYLIDSQAELSGNASIQYSSSLEKDADKKSSHRNH